MFPTRKMKPMFDSDDINEMLNFKNRVPDGLIDGTTYAEIFTSITNMLDSIDSPEPKQAMMYIAHCINACYDIDSNGKTTFSKNRAADAIVALAYHSMMMTVAMEQTGIKEEYFRYTIEEVLPILHEEAGAIPYYSFADEVRSIAKMEDELDEMLGRNDKTD